MSDLPLGSLIYFSVLPFFLSQILFLSDFFGHRTRRRWGLRKVKENLNRRRRRVERDDCDYAQIFFFNDPPF